LLLSGSSLLSSLGLQLSVDDSLSESSKDRLLSLFLGDLSRGDGQLLSLDRNNILMSVLRDVRQLFSGGITLLGLLAGLGEDDKLGLVLLNAVNVGCHGCFILVSASSINSDSDGASELHWNTGLLQLNGGETSTLANLEVVSLSGRDHDRSEEPCNRSGENRSSLSLARESSCLMASWLVEPSPDVGVVLK
jgi:hypothetical protein